MKVVLITGSGGLIGSESVEFFSSRFDQVIGVDNNLRSHFFGDHGSVEWRVSELKEQYSNYQHHSVDVRDADKMEKIFSDFGKAIELVVHAAAQPSHDWAAKDPTMDFTVNANGTLVMLECTRKYCPDAVFVFTSTNKVYGDTPNLLPLIEKETRWEVDPGHPMARHGIDETMTIDQSKHSLFGVSKVAADVLVQEYGRYFGLRTGVFRGGCLTGPNHSGAMLHGFLSYLMRCAITGKEYSIFGYKGKQVRDNIHSHDLINMFWHFFQAPRPGEVYNAGGSRHSNCSMLEAIKLCEEISGRKMNYRYVDQNRIGDHIWYISDVRKFRQHYPRWEFAFDLRQTLNQMHEKMIVRLKR